MTACNGGEGLPVILSESSSTLLQKGERQHYYRFPGKGSGSRNIGSKTTCGSRSHLILPVIWKYSIVSILRAQRSHEVWFGFHTKAASELGLKPGGLTLRVDTHHSKPAGKRNVWAESCTSQERKCPQHCSERPELPQWVLFSYFLESYLMTESNQGVRQRSQRSTT